MSDFRNAKWSFSRISTYDNCPKCFYLSYVLKIRKIQNAFAEFGSWCHALLEMYFKGKVEFYELSQLYVDGYTKHIKKKFPKSFRADLAEIYYYDGKRYFDSFEGIPSKYKIVGIEQKINLNIHGYTFIGVIDLILEDEIGNYIVWDHKSKSKFNSKKERDKYLRQLYLYSIYIEEKYGKPPIKLVFNMFRKGEIVETSFDKSKQIDAVEWFVNTISLIVNDQKFIDKISKNYEENEKDISEFKKDDFFCNQLCGVRKHCERSKSYKQ